MKFTKFSIILTIVGSYNICYVNYKYVYPYYNILIYLDFILYKRSILNRKPILYHWNSPIQSPLSKKCIKIN